MTDEQKTISDLQQIIRDQEARYAVLKNKGIDASTVERMIGQFNLLMRRVDRMLTAEEERRRSRNAAARRSRKPKRSRR